MNQFGGWHTLLVRQFELVEMQRRKIRANFKKISSTEYREASASGTFNQP